MVTTRTLFRLGGLALMIALPLQVAGYVLHPPSETAEDVLKATYGSAHLVLWGSWLLLALALPALYARQATRVGASGLQGSWRSCWPRHTTLTCCSTRRTRRRCSRRTRRRGA